MPPDVSIADPPQAPADAPLSSDHPFERIDGDLSGGLLLLCDHASNRVPDGYGDLGLPDSAFARHIAYDIGCERLTRHLADLSGAPALMTRFTRLLIDPNRGEDDPTLVMRLSDGAVVEGNADVDETERRQRIIRFHRPYHDAISRELDRMIASGHIPAIVSIHSFTPAWKGTPRPWHAGILWDADPRLAVPLIEGLASDGDIVVGDNEPYDGALRGDTMFRHATRRGLAHALVEVRQDLIAEDAGAVAWAERIWRQLESLLRRSHMHEVIWHGSRTGAVDPA